MTGVTSTPVMRTRIQTHSKTDQRRTVLVADGSLEGLVHTEEPSLRARLAARWRPRRLDRALAAGIPPEADVALALRAEELTELNRRRTIAECAASAHTRGARGRTARACADQARSQTRRVSERGAERARRNAGGSGSGRGEWGCSGMDPAHGRDRPAVQPVQPDEPCEPAPPAPPGGCGPGSLTGAASP